MKLLPALVLSVMAAPVLSAAAATQPVTIERIVAVVNDEIILDTELEQFSLLQQRSLPDVESAAGRKAWEEIKRKVLDQMIDSRLMVQQATELKLTVTQDEVDRGIEEVKRQNQLDDSTFGEALKQQGLTMETYRKTLRRQILEQKVISTAVRSRISVSDDEVKSYYQQNVRQLGGEKSVHLQQIQLAVADEAGPQELERKRALAARIVQMAQSGTPFEQLSRTYSDDATTKEQGGDSGWIGPGVLDDNVQAAVVGMDPGDVRGPIRTARGFLVLKLLERKSDVRPLEEVKDQLRKQLYDQQLEKGLQAWSKELRKKAHVEVRLRPKDEG